MADDTLSTLAQIRVKVRRVTRSPSESQITTAEIDNYVNTFVLYDFPQQIRTFNLRKKLTFYTQPYIDTYGNNTTDVNSPLYNFKNLYTGIYSPVYVGGTQVSLYFSEAQFYSIYPKTNNVETIATGNGALATYSGTLLNKPVLPGSVVFSAVDINDNGLSLKDVELVPPGHNATLNDTTTGAACGTLNYVTGVYTLTFLVAPKLNAKIDCQSITYQPSKPQSVLYFDTKFVLRPVPDKPYPIELEVNVRPTELLAANTMPELSQWWQYIALGASRKIFQDRMDTESVQAIEPEFREQEALCMRSKIAMLSNSRAQTIYAPYEWNNWSGGSWSGGSN